MITYLCKCGKSIAWSADGIRPCQVCDECGSTLSCNGDYVEPEPHEWKLQYNVNSGKPDHKRCVKCGKYKKLKKE